jgi:phage terminase large subunit
LLPEAYQFLRQPIADDGLPVRYRAVYGGRGSAKSHSFAQQLLLDAYERPLRIGCFREIQRSIRDSVKRLLDDKIGASPELAAHYSTTDTEIRGANGSLFIFNGLRSNPDAVKSTEGMDRAAVFEANKVSRRSWDLLIPTVRKDGSEIWAEWNPEFPDDPVDQMFRGESMPPGTILRRVNWDDNPFFPDVLRKEMEYDRSRDPEKYAHIWLGEYQRHSETRVFKNWRVEEFERPEGAIYRLGADWGYAIDPSVLIRCSIEGKRLYVDHEAYMIGCEIDQLPDLFDRVPDARKWFITADSARPETISYMRKHGYPKINPAIKGPRSIEDGVAWLQSYDIIVHPRCTHVIDELTLYSYKQDPLTGKVLPMLEDKHNHCIDSLRYACEGARKAVNINATRKIVYPNSGVV